MNGSGGPSIDLYLRLNYHRIKAEAHVNPLPNAARQIKLFSFIFPSAHASLIAIGMDAAVVFPYRMILLYTFESGSPNFC